MGITHRHLVLVLSLPVFLVGCTGGSANQPRAAQGDRPAVSQSADQPGEENGIQEALAKLPPEDRRLAEEQQFCAVLNEHRLGSMGTPVKVLVEDQPVFLCCKGCQKKALAEPEQTLIKVQELRAKTAGTPAK